MKRRERGSRTESGSTTGRSPVPGRERGQHETTPVGSARPAAAPTTADGLGVFLAVLAFGVLALHASRYLPFIADDAFISLRYADRFLHGHGLTWNDGERVEGYSNLLWVLLCSGLGAAGIDLVTAARLLGFAGGAATVAALAWAFAPASAGGALPALAGTLAIALAAPIAVWTIGGLEGTLVTALLAWAVALTLRLLAPDPSRRAATVSGVLLGLLCITRPDGFVLALGTIAGVMVARRCMPATRPLVLRLAAGPLAFTLAQLTFRLAYYGEWIANSARVKLGFSIAHLGSGLLYLVDGLFGYAPLVLGVALAWGVSRRLRDGRGAMVLPVVVALVWAAYVAVIGGDLFPGRRFLLPLCVLLAFLAAEAVRRAGAARAPAWAWGTLAVLALVFGGLQLADPAAARTRLERWELDGKPVGKFLARAFGDRAPLIAVDPAGAVPYWSRLPAIDMLGLNDRWLAHHPPPGFGSGRLGHELGNGRYVLSRKPDLVLLCLPTGRDTGCFIGGKQLVADPEFQASYRLATYEGDEPFRVRSRIWTRREGGALGIARSPGRVVVPGWQLSANPASVVGLDATGRPAMHATQQTPALLVGLELPAGLWRLAIDSDTQMRVELRDVAHGTVLGRGVDTLTFVHPGGLVDLGVMPVANVLAHVRAVTFTAGP